MRIGQPKGLLGVTAVVLGAVCVLAAATAVQGADVFMTASDGFGTTSFDAAGQWSDGQAPSAGNDYFLEDFRLRTPADSLDHTFLGGSLTVNDSADSNETGLTFKGNVSVTLTVPNLILDGGQLIHLNGSDQVWTQDGGVTVASESRLWPKQGAINIAAPISGSGTLLISAGDENNERFNVRFSGDNSAYAGDVNVSGRLMLEETGVMGFQIGTDGVNNQITGSGTATYNGTFAFDLTNASAATGDSWSVATVASQSYGETFTVDGFVGTNGVWTNGEYRFDQVTGILSYGIEAPYTWDGGVSGLWSVAANWSNDTLPDFFGYASSPSFSGLGVTNGSVENDIVGAELEEIAFAANAEGGFVLSGNAASVSESISNLSSYEQTVAFDVTAGGSGDLDLVANGAALEVSGKISGTTGLLKSGGQAVVLSNPDNDFSGKINFSGDGDLVVTASGAMGDPVSTIGLPASYQGSLGTLVFNGDQTHTKAFAFNSRQIGEPAHIIATNGLVAVDGEAYGYSGGPRYIIRVEGDAELNWNTDLIMISASAAQRLLRVDGDGVLNLNGDLTDAPDGTRLGVGKANGGLGQLNIVGMKSYSGDTFVDSGLLALVDPTSSNNVPNSLLLASASTNGFFDFTGLAGGGIVLAGGQTLGGIGEVFGSVTAGPGSILSPAEGNVGTIGIPALTLEGGSTLRFDLSANDNDKIIVGAGGLVGASSGVVALDIEVSGGIAGGSYVVMDWSQSSASGVELSDFSTDTGTLAIENGKLVVQIEIVSLGKVLVADTENLRIVKYDVSQFGVWSPDEEQPVFAEGTVGLWELLDPVALATDGDGHVYIAEGLIDQPNRVMELDGDGAFLRTIAENGLPGSTEFDGTPKSMVVDPSGSYLYISIAEANQMSSNDTLEDVIIRVDLSGSAAPAVYIPTAIPGSDLVLSDPAGLAFGPDGYLYVGNNVPEGTGEGSRVYRFDVSGAAPVFMGKLTTEHREIKDLFYDEMNSRLLVSLNALNDIWAYTDLSLDEVAEGDASFEYVYNSDTDADYPAVIQVAGDVYYANASNNTIQRVVSDASVTTALGAEGGLVNPLDMVVLSQVDPLDLDLDGVFDLNDWAVFVDLMTGPGASAIPAGVDPVAYDRADIDNDGDVDLADAAVFMNRLAR